VVKERLILSFYFDKRILRRNIPMAITNQYLSELLETVKKRNAGEPEFIQTVTEVLETIQPVIEKRPDLIEAGVLERIVEPERQIMFRVPWVDDNGKVQVNRGFRVQFNSAIGPYKGGLRFHPSVYLGIIKFLGFEQIFKNSLTSLPMGGGKGGSDFDPQGKSDREVMAFCQSFMTELSKHIGADLDVPAGDIGVGAREIGYMFGQYKRLRNEFTGVLTGKGIPYGGSLIRPEATGFGAVYYTVEMLKHFGDDIKGKTVAVSGFGNVAWGVALKVTELGGKVVTISGPDGYIYDKDGINTPEKIEFMLEMRASCRNRAEDYADKFGAEFHKGEKPWGVKADIIMPCATQNEVDMAEAKQIVENGVKYYVEVSNMPTTNEAVAYLKENGVIVAPSKAVNAGGVAVSALEMSQNSMRYSWSAEEVDAKLQGIMKHIYDVSVEAAEQYGFGYDLVAGANIAGSLKVAEAMMQQGTF
jgi:glutamate dehydrogenase (NADP+)